MSSISDGGPAERKKGLTPTDAAKTEDAAFRKAREADKAAHVSGGDRRQAFESVYLENHPTPGYISRHQFVYWNPDTIAQAIGKLIKIKENKVRENVSKYDEIWLVIFTDEHTITEGAVFSAKQRLKDNRKLFKRVFVVPRYEFEDYSVVEI